MQLALDMGATLTELNQRMTGREAGLWLAFNQLQPRGVVRDDYHSARLCALLATIYAPKGKTFTVQDFMFEDPNSKQKREFQNFAARFRARAQPKKK